MTKVDIEIHSNVVDIYNKIKDIDDTGIEIDIPEGSVLFDNTLNIKLLKRILQRDSKVLTLTTEDPKGKLLMDIIDDNVTTDTATYIKYEPKGSIFEKFKSFKRPNIDFSKIGGILPKINFPKSGFIIPLVVVILVIGIGFFALQKTHKASAKIVVESQTLTRSITINVKKGASNDFANNIIKGSEIQKTIQNIQSAPTTGEKLIGTTAKGEVTVYNRTTTDKNFKKGEILIYENNNKEYKYKITSDITVLGAKSGSTDPAASLVPGEKLVNVEALVIGEEYNISKDKTLNFDEYKSSEFAAKATSAITGGKKETKKAVAQVDMDTLKEKLLKQNKEDIQKELEKNSSNSSKYIKGSEDIAVIKETFSDKLNDDAIELKLDQTITATGLSYSQSDIDNLIASTLKNLIPEGYEVSTQDKEIKVEVLGNSTKTVLNKNQADIQVTLKLFIVPTIDTEKLKDELKNKNIEEGQKIINNINNVKTYEINTFPNIPMFKKFPSDTTKIDIKIEKE